MIRRRIFVGALAAAIAAPLSGEAQQSRTLYRVGLLSLGPPSTFPRLVDAFRQGMREAGYIEGRHYVLEMRNAAGKPDELQAAARALVATGPDAILVGAGITLAAVTAATQNVPIVVAGPDPIRHGVAASLARPGGNVTGLVGSQLAELSGKWVELLREFLPSLSRILLVMNPASQSDQAREIEAVAQTHGIAFIRIAVTKAEDIETRLANLSVRRGDGFIVLSESPVWARRTRITEIAARKKVPAMYTLKEYVEAGGLFSYAASFEDLFRRSALYIDKILRGAKPSDLPIELPIKFELVINMKTARALNLTIPPSLLLRADQVIE